MRSPTLTMTICADPSVPLWLVDQLRLQGDGVRTSPYAGVRLVTPHELLRWTRRSLAVLLTCDRGFWRDELPIADVPGVIILDIDRERPVQALDALRLVTKTFVRRYDMERWEGMKVLASAAGCAVKMLNQDGSIDRYAIRGEAGLLFIERGQPSEGVYGPSRAGRAEKVPA